MKNRYVGFGYFVLCLIAILCWSIPSYASTTKNKSRAINIVYDDSGSMAARYEKGKPVGTETKWSQAKYAMKVFISMMGDNDTIKVFPMSGNSNGKQKGIITINGSMTLSERNNEANRINTSVTGGTPFATVESAAESLSSTNADEKWLIVLTDGLFDEFKKSSDKDSDTRSAMKQYSSNPSMNVVYVGIGDTVTDMSSLNSNTFSSYNGINENKILSTITEIARKVYNYQPLNLKGGAGKYSFKTDIPVSKVVIFAQGGDITVGDLTLDKKDLSILPADVSLNVLKDVEKEPSVGGWKNGLAFAPGLEGKIITYNALDLPFGVSEGLSNFDFSCNTDNVEVYFEPGVDINIVLTGEDGQDFSVSEENLDTIESGNYTVGLKMVNPLNGKELKSGNSELLGEVSLSLTLQNEEGDTQKVMDGDIITLPTGAFKLKTKAEFKGDIEKNDIYNLSVIAGDYDIRFSNDSYKMDMESFKSNEDVMFQVTDKKGYIEDIINEDITVSSKLGIEYLLQKVEKGTFQLIPQYDADLAMDIHDPEEVITVEVANGEGKNHRKGIGSTNIGFFADEVLKLQLTVISPELKYPEETPSYMFDSNNMSDTNPEEYIYIKTQVVMPDGSLRDLTAKEWSAGCEGLKFKTISNDGDFSYRILRKVYGQKLLWKVELSDTPSEYKVFPYGIHETKILPNNSKIEITQEVELENGIKEFGNTETDISIRPLQSMVYWGWILAILTAIVLLMIYLIAYIRKPKIDRDVKPRVTVMGFVNDIPDKPIKKNCAYKKKHRFPSLRAETMTITVNTDGRIDQFSFTIVAKADGEFKIDSLSSFSRFDRDKRSVFIARRSLEEFKKNSKTLDSSSKVTIKYKKLRREGTVNISFR